MEKISRLSEVITLMRLPESEARYPDGKYPWEELAKPIMQLLEAVDLDSPHQLKEAQLVVLYGLRYDEPNYKVDPQTELSAHVFIDIFGENKRVRELVLSLLRTKQFDQKKLHPLVSCIKGYNAKMSSVMLEFMIQCIKSQCYTLDASAILWHVANFLLTPKKRRQTKDQLATHLRIIQAMHSRFFILDIGYPQNPTVGHLEFRDAISGKIFLEPGYMERFYKKHLYNE